MKRLFLLLVAALALLVPVVGQAASGPVLNFYAPNTTTPAITNFSYGAVPPGAPGVSKTFTLKNTGGSATAALKITLTPAAGTPASAFTKTGDTCSQPVPISLGKGKTCQITIRFTPVAAGESDAADLTAVSKKPNASRTLHLTGSGRVDSDLSLDLTRTLTSDLDGNGQNSIGDRVTFTLILDNAGPDAAASVHVADLLPAGYLFFVASASQGTYTSATGDWNVGTVSVASTPTLSIVTTVRGGNPVSAYTNYAQVSASGSFDPDSTPGNDSTTEDDDASVTPPIADLSVTNAVALAPGGDLDGSGSLTVGDQVVFTLTVSNGGPDSAPLVQISDRLAHSPPSVNGFTYVGDDGLGTYDPVTGLWDVGEVAPGTTQTLHVTATVDPTGPYRNAAQVTSFGFALPFPGSERNEWFDPDSTANNNVGGEDDQATVTPSVVNQAPTVQLTVVSQTPPFGFGDVVDFTVQVTDDAPFDCARVSVAYILGHSTHGHPKSSTAGCVGSITVSPDASHAGANNIYAWFFASYTDLGAPPLQGSDDVFLYDPLASFPDVIASCESFGGTFSLGGSNPDSYWTCAAWDSADVAEFETRDALLATACVSSARIFHTASAETDGNPGAESTTECEDIPPTT